MRSNLDWPMLRNYFISEIRARLKAAAVLERLEVSLQLGLWQLSLVGPGNSKRHLLGASSTRLTALLPSVPPWHGTCHLWGKAAIKFWPASLSCFSVQAAAHAIEMRLWIKGMPVHFQFLNVRIKRELTTHRIGRNCSYIIGLFCDCSH